MAVEIDAIQSAKSIGWTDALLSRLAANSVGLGARLSITAPANASALSSTGYSLTGSNAQSMIDLAGTWNTTGNPVALKIAMSNTASGATSKFISLLAGASGTTEVFNVDKSGNISCTGALKLLTDARITTDGAYTNSLILQENGFSRLAVAGDVRLLNCALGFGASTSIAATDTYILRDAANTLALRNGANAQAFNIYNTYTSGSVYERGFMRWASNVLEIGAEHVGASNRVVRISAYSEIQLWNRQFGYSMLSTTSAGLIQFGSSISGPITGNNQCYLGLVEMTSPAAPAANGVYIFAEDNGSGKTRLMARFATGATQQIAIEP